MKLEVKMKPGIKLFRYLALGFLIINLGVPSEDLSASDSVVFRDDFMGKALNPEWDIGAKDTNRMALVDNEYLLLVTYGSGSNAKNRMTYKGDLPENYENQPAFQFIRDVGVDWEQTVVLDGEVGDFVTIAREEKDTGNWFLGSITDENPRDITIDFSFLEEGKTYQAAIYRDGENAHYKTNPLALEIEKMDISKGDSKTFHLAAGGGLAMSLMEGE